MRATRTFTDERGNLRKNGEEWLITFNDTEAHIPGIYEEVSMTYINAVTLQSSYTDYS